jgi:lipopolysaccharide transport system ATP-binding protein
MSSDVRPIIAIRHLSKRYRLGAIGATTLGEEISRFWARVRGRSQSERQILPELGEAALRGGRNTDQREFWALRDVSLDVQPGEVVGIVGRNGAGKSTLLKILSRVTTQTSGVITLRGRVASLLEVGTGFHPDLTGRENVFLNGAMLGMKRAEIRAKFDEIVAFAEIDRFIDTPVKRYSSGMYVRLAFSIAAHLEPDILVVDEVLAVGDAAFQKKCLGKMDDVATGKGRTVLFVSHNVATLAAVCQTGMVLRAGVATFRGRIDDAIAHYVSDVERETTRSYRSTYAAIDERDLCFTAVSVVDGEGLPRDGYSMESPINIIVEYDVARPLARVQVVCHVWNRQGVHVLATADIDFDPELLEGRLPGSYRAEICLPAMLLAPGHYRVSVACGVPNLRLIDEQDGPAFDVHSVGSYAAQWSSARRDVIVGLPVRWNSSPVEAREAANTA